MPEGTVIKDQDGIVLADLVHTGDRFLAAEGGRGGRGNARFLSNRRRAPGFAEQGEVGEERWLRLELKLLADVALVGFPSVGKSTLISVISAAQPKIADYPFTTLEPNLGVVRTDDGVEIVVADLPGLIEGASEGRGLGHRFLRHVERARVLVVLLDLSPHRHAPARRAGATSSSASSADYDPDLLDPPRLVVGSRADLDDGTWSWDGRAGQRRSPATACPQLVGRMVQAVTDERRAAHPERRGLRGPPPRGRTGYEVVARRGRRLGRDRARRPSVPWPCPTSPTPRRSTRPIAGCTPSASTGRSPGPAPSQGDTVRIGSSRSTTRPSEP